MLKVLFGAFFVFGASPAMAFVAGRLWDSEPSLVLLPALIAAASIYLSFSLIHDGRKALEKALTPNAESDTTGTR